MVAALLLACQEEQSLRVPPEMPNVEKAVRPGFDKPMLPVYKTDAEKMVNKGDSYGDYKDSHPEWYGISNPPTADVRPAAEWESAQKLIITYSSNSLPSGIKKNFADIVKYGKPVVDIYVVYDGANMKSAFQNLLSSYGVSSSGLNWMQMDNDSIWVRDYGPFSILSGGKVGFTDFRYYHQRIYDDATPAKQAIQWNISDYRMPVDFEGGNFMSDTKGNCFTTEGLLMYNGVGESTLKGYFKDYMGCNQLHIIKPMANEGTTHIDMSQKLVDDNTVIVGEYSANADYANYQIQNQNAAVFEGLGWNVVRMPMPNNSGNVFRSYINSLFVNNVNMWPTYSVDKDMEAEAAAIWEATMPGYQHVGMNSDDVIQWAGAIHCITMTVATGSLSKIDANPGYACNGDWDCYPGGSSQGCDGITYEGCCDGQLLKYCENGQLKQMNCGSQPQCGWDAQGGFYNCGTNGGSDPSGDNPKPCDGGCTPNCANKECGSDGCGGSCGTCDNGEACQSGQCVGCTPDCTGKECGDDGCGGSCGTCQPGFGCQANKCVEQGGGCGSVTYEGCCEGTVLKYCENDELVSGDCGGEGCGWNNQSSYYDCGQTGSDPSGQHPKECDGGCTPDCAGKECGNDGCGGTCGQCGPGENCQSNQCVAGPDNCQGITYEGCCSGQQLQWCENGQLTGLDCAGNPNCGWDGNNGYYNCGTSGAADPSGANPISCDGGCTPQCAGKECGDDGCGGSCGSCPEEWTCDGTGHCVFNCIPDCTGKDCGDDGCGGSCGTCPDGNICQFGKCQAVADPCQGITWEGCCEGTVLHYCENDELVSGDCGGNGCGWNDANSYYDCGQAGADPSGANPLECPGSGCLPNCGDKECGDDGCGGSCGTCGAGSYCLNGLCQAENECGDVTYQGKCEGTVLSWCQDGDLVTFDCTDLGANFVCKFQNDQVGFNCVEESGCLPNCADKECGDDGCGGTCGKCPEGLSCQEFHCTEGPCTPDCANMECGDDGCGGSCGSCPGGWYCENGHCNTDCVPNCDGKECGSDGCDASCGVCADGQTCLEGLCQDQPCQPDCTGKDCGTDGCDGSCGSCGDAETCENGKCIAVCQPDCGGKECGSDGCTGSCGVCPPGFSCDGGQCEQGCTGDCAGKACGDDGCGGLCGSCPAGQVCQDGQCQPDCIPNCVDKKCGPDGCGGDCGNCPKDFTCSDGDCVQAPSGCGNITSTGKCEGTLLKKCVSNQVVTVDCAETAKQCSFVPETGLYDCVEQCVPNCLNKECGPDGCGGTCGGCAKGYGCEEGLCKAPDSPCTPACGGLECGDDGCGGSCGECAEGATCTEGKCGGEGDCPDGQEWNGVECADVIVSGGGSSGCSTTGAGSTTPLVLLAMLFLAAVTGSRRKLER